MSRAGELVCQICSEAGIPDAIGLAQHLLANHVSDPAEQVETAAKRPGGRRVRESKTYVCPEKHCGKVYRRPQCFKRHRDEHENSSLFVSQGRDGKRTYRCPHEACFKTFVRQSSYSRHKAEHRGAASLMCRFCGKTFHRGDSLQSHEFTHSTEKPHACGFCGQSFKWKSARVRHERRRRCLSPAEEATEKKEDTK